MLLSQGGQKEAAECGEDPPAWMRRDRKGEKKVSSFPQNSQILFFSQPSSNR